jgi:signal transduction histidine kinase
MRLNSKAGGIVACGLCITGYQLLRFQVGKTAAYIFAVLVLGTGLAMQISYRRRLRRLRDMIAAMPEDERQRCLREIDPEIAEELHKK